MTEETLKKAQDIYEKILNLKKEIESIEERNEANQYKSSIKISMNLPYRGWINKEFQPDNIELLIENHVLKLQSKLKDLETQLELLI